MFRYFLLEETKPGKDTNKKYYIDPSVIHVPRANVEMMSPLKDGMVEDWDLFEKLLDHSYKNHIRSQSDIHPVLMTEAPVSFEINNSFLKFCTIRSFLYEFIGNIKIKLYLSMRCFFTQLTC